MAAKLFHFVNLYGSMKRRVLFGGFSLMAAAQNVNVRRSRLGKYCNVKRNCAKEPAAFCLS